MTDRIEIKLNSDGAQFKDFSGHGHGKTGQIKKASWLGKSIKVESKLHLNKGSLIDFLNNQYLNNKTDQPKLKKDWFLGLLGGDSNAQVLQVFNEFLNEQECSSENSETDEVKSMSENLEINTLGSVENSQKDDLAKDWNFFSHSADVDFENVQVFILAEDHTNDNHRKFIGNIINANYREGDLILVEGTPRGKTIKSDPETKYVNPGYLQKGWDINKKNYFNNNKAIVEFTALQKACEDFATEMCPNEDLLSSENRKSIEARAEDFVRELEYFYEFFIDDANEREDKKNSFLNSLNKISTLNIVDNRAKLHYFILSAINESYFKEKSEDLKYNYISPKETKKINSDFSKRNESLCKAIEENCEPGRRVFVIAGPLHLFKSNNASYKSTDDVKNTIKKYPFVIASPKMIEEKHKELKIKHLNNDYIKISNPFKRQSQI